MIETGVLVSINGCFSLKNGCFGILKTPGCLKNGCFSIKNGSFGIGPGVLCIKNVCFETGCFDNRVFWFFGPGVLVAGSWVKSILYLS